jgi:hypothetical protein
MLFIRSTDGLVLQILGLNLYWPSKDDNPVKLYSINLSLSHFIIVKGESAVVYDFAQIVLGDIIDEEVPLQKEAEVYTFPDNEIYEVIEATRYTYRKRFPFFKKQQLVYQVLSLDTDDTIKQMSFTAKFPMEAIEKFREAKKLLDLLNSFKTLPGENHELFNASDQKNP